MDRVYDGSMWKSGRRKNGQGIRWLNVEMLEREEEWTGNMMAQCRNNVDGGRMDREYEGSR